MISMHGVPSSLIARNESWVRKQAATLARRLPSNVEKADLIQAGLIAVAQSAIGFKWEGDPDTEEAKEAFVRYARMRVKGAMLDELRQMDHLDRGQRRKIKVIQIARERWQSVNGAEPGLEELSKASGIGMDELLQLERAAQATQTQSLDEDPDSESYVHVQHPATAQDEVEARVDTGILMRKLEKFFAKLPERDRQVIDSYLGVGMTPVQLASSLNLSASRISRLYKAAVERIAHHFSHDQRAFDRLGNSAATQFEQLVEEREAQLAREAADSHWETLVESALDSTKEMSNERFGAPAEHSIMKVDGNTRW
jgi:RNA polymerase sigma factor for flagellar operon FliA